MATVKESLATAQKLQKTVSELLKTAKVDGPVMLVLAFLIVSVIVF